MLIKMVRVHLSRSESSRWISVTINVWVGRWISESKNDYGYFASESALSLTGQKLPSSWVGASVFTALNPWAKLYKDFRMSKLRNSLFWIL